MRHAYGAKDLDHGIITTSNISWNGESLRNASAALEYLIAVLLLLLLLSWQASTWSDKWGSDRHV